MLKKRGNKKAVSTVIITVLLILLALTIAGIVYLSSKNFSEKLMRKNAQILAEMDCPTNFNFNLYACYNKAGNNIYIEINNLKEEIPEGSLIAIMSGADETLVPMNQMETVDEGGAASFTAEIPTTILNFQLTTPEKLKIIPAFQYKSVRVLCEDTPEVELEECS